MSKAKCKMSNEGTLPILDLDRITVLHLAFGFGHFSFYFPCPSKKS